MKSIPLSTLVPSIYFDQPVYLDKSYILLTPDSPVTPELVKRLQKWKYQQVFTEGKTKDVPSYLSGSTSSSVAPQTIDEDIRENAQVLIFEFPLIFGSPLLAAAPLPIRTSPCSD